MSIKKFIMSGLALGTMLMASAPAQAATFNLGTLPSSGITGKQVTNTGSSDVFKFVHNGGELNLGVVNVTNGKNFRISLYEDTDHDGVYNPNPNHDTLVNNSKFGAENGDREIFTRQKAGTYFAIVSSTNSSTANYTFIGSSTSTNQSNLIAASKVLSSLNAQFQLLPLDDKKTSDFYKFDLTSGQQVKITMTPTGGKAQMRVVQDVSADHSIVLGSEIVSSTPASSSQQTLTVKGPGQYYLQVSQSTAGQSVATNVKFSP